MAAPFDPAPIPLRGIVRLQCRHNVEQTIGALRASFERHGLKVFAHVDFAADAKAAGLSLRPEQLLIFGNPQRGTVLLQPAPGVGLDLPLKALVWEDETGTVWLAYNESAYIVSRHNVPPQLIANIESAAALLRDAADPPT